VVHITRIFPMQLYNETDFSRVRIPSHTSAHKYPKYHSHPVQFPHGLKVNENIDHNLQSAYIVSQKTSHLWLAVTLTQYGFWYLLAEIGLLRIK